MPLSRQLIVLVCFSIVLGLGARVVQKSTVPSYWGFPKPIELIKAPEALAEAQTGISADSAFAPADKPYEINMSQMMGLYMKAKKEGIPVIDARDPKLYEEGHIKGAVNIPYEKYGLFQEKIDSLPKDKLIILYCDGGDCHLSHDLSEVLLGEGFKRLAIFTGGWAEWKETDFTATGKE